MSRCDFMGVIHGMAIVTKQVGLCHAMVMVHLLMIQAGRKDAEDYINQ